MVRVRRFLAILLSFVLCCTALTAGTGAAELLYGDPSGDGSINASDALLALQHSVALITLTDEEFQKADVNSSGTVDASDALLILQKSVGLLEQFPIKDYRTTVDFPWGDESMYCTETESFQLEGIVTTCQQGGYYSGEHRMPLDSIMVYINHEDNLNTLQSWAASGMRVDTMFAAFRDGDQYFEDYPERYPDEVQTRKDGTLGGTLMTQNYVEYKWEIIRKACEAGVGAIVIEEPSVRKFIGYSNAFKAEWEAYYGEEWQDPESSAQNRYKRHKLISYMMVRMIRTIGERIKENYPDIEFYVANHSLYKDAPNFVSATAEFAALECVDGIIGQTWSNTARESKPYGGGKVQRVFQSAYLGYGVSLAATADKTFFALNDAKADGESEDWVIHRRDWHHQIVAQLMHPEINRFQAAIWTGRSFSGAPAEYQTEQLTVMQVLQNVGGLDTSLYSGTPGVALATSSTLSWQTTGYGESSFNSPYSILLPLLEKGIPVESLSLDRLTDISQLEDLKVIILTLDSYKPQTEQPLEILAEWVKQGGVLLCAGVLDDYADLDGSWWSEKGETPFTSLAHNLGMEGLTVSLYENVDALRWSGASGYGDSFNDSFIYGDYVVSFSGSGVSPILTADNTGECIGFEKAIGEGRLLVSGMDSGYFCTTESGPQQIRDLTAYALRYTDTPYVESNLLAIRRGPYLAAHALETEEVLTGRFVNLFDPNLPVVDSVMLEGASSALLYDISELEADDIPRLCITGGDLTENPVETAEATSYTIYGPAESTSAARILCNGKTVDQVICKRGEREMECGYAYDEASDSILITLENNATVAQTVTVTWK